MRFDAIIVGGGPAGLSAALLLGRCRRSVALIDDGRPRNAVSAHAHGFFTREGTPPLELLRIGREQLAPFDVMIFKATALDVQTKREGFSVTLSTRKVVTGRKLLLATGLKDELPPVDGIEAFYGKSVFHCPYCDGWEMRDLPLAAYGQGQEGAEFAMGLKVWSDDVILCTNGVRRMPAAAKAALDRHGIRVHVEPIARLEGRKGMLERIVFDHGAVEERRALFFHASTAQRSPLAAQLGLDFNLRGAVRTGTFESTKLPGVYVAGDASKDVTLISVAVAEGTKAAFAINRALRMEDF